MKKIAKKITAATMAAALVMSSITCMSANAATNAYATSKDWELHYYTYDQKLSQTLTLVADGNGYNAYIMGKSGDCSLNYVSISAPYTTTESISEKRDEENEHIVFMKPSRFTKDYVVFTVKLTYGNGSRAFNSGTIETV